MLIIILISMCDIWYIYIYNIYKKCNIIYIYICMYIYTYVSSLAPSYLLKVTKFSDFNYFLCKNCNTTIKKVTTNIPSNSPLKIKVFSSPIFLKIWLEVEFHLPPPPSKERVGGAHVFIQICFILNTILSFKSN